MMKAAQGPGVQGGLPLSAPNQGSHSPQHQNMHQGLFENQLYYNILNALSRIQSYNNR